VLNNASSSAFVSLCDLLREKRAACVPARTELEEAKPPAAEYAGTSEIIAFVEEIAMLRLRVVESFERLRKSLLHRFAEEILVRELQLSPVDIEAIARKTLEAFAQESPISLAVCPADAARLRADSCICVDESLEPGDIIADIADGYLESPLRLRVERSLQETLREEGPI
jgi:hypothetical protein